MKNTTDTIIAAHERLTSLADTDEVFKDLSRLLKIGVKSSWLAIYLYDHDRRNFSSGLTYGLSPDYSHLFDTLPFSPQAIPLLKGLMRKRDKLLLTRAAADLLTPEAAKLLEDTNILVVPLAANQQQLGVALIAREIEHRPFSEEEASTVRDMVSYAAMVVSNISLFEQSLEMSLEVAKRIDVILTLDEINKAISSSLSPAKIIDTAMERIERIIVCSLVAVLVEKEGKLTVMAARTEGMPLPPVLQKGAVAGRCTVSGMAHHTGKSRYVGTLSAVKRMPFLDRRLQRAGIESMLATPLITKGKGAGVLLLGDLSRNRFVQEEAFTIEKIAAQMAVALDNARLFEEMKALFISTVASLANAIDAKSPWTKGHSERVMRTAALIADKLGLSEEQVEWVRLGGLLHDIGKIGVMEAVLEKPASLSEDEFPPMRLHPKKGVEILAPIRQLKHVLPGILHHHEHYDGSGYPDGLKGEEIPIAARIISVADAYDAIVAARPYKGGHSAAAALAELRRCSGTQFDPVVVSCFTEYMEKKLSAEPG